VPGSRRVTAPLRSLTSDQRILVARPTWATLAGCDCWRAVEGVEVLDGHNVTNGSWGDLSRRPKPAADLLRGFVRSAHHPSSKRIRRPTVAGLVLVLSSAVLLFALPSRSAMAGRSCSGRPVRFTDDVRPLQVRSIARGCRKRTPGRNGRRRRPESWLGRWIRSLPSTTSAGVERLARGMSFGPAPGTRGVRHHAAIVNSVLRLPPSSAGITAGQVITIGATVEDPGTSSNTILLREELSSLMGSVHHARTVKILMFGWGSR